MLSVGISVYALSCWGQKRFQYYASFCLVITFYAVGYILEMNATTFEGALYGCKIIYCGSPFVGVFFYLFALDFANRPRPKRWIIVCLLIIQGIFTFAVLSYPLTNLYYADLQFTNETGIGSLVKEPGLFYYPNFILVFIFTIIASVILVRSFISERRYDGIVIFATAVITPIVMQVLAMFSFSLLGWNPVPMSLVLSIGLLTIYLVRYRKREWQTMGRDLVVQNMQDAFILLDTKNRLIDHNLAAEQLYPTLATVKKATAVSEIKDFPAEALVTQGYYSYEHVTQNRTLQLRMASTTVFSGDIKVGTSIVISDETESQRLMQELTRLARRDDLTGLNNRVTFFSDAQVSFDISQRQKGASGCALMLDIDFFKAVNDTYGHAVGDEVLRYIGSVIANRFRATDISGRYGGEEFCVWMPVTDMLGAKRVAEEIRTTVESHSFNIDDNIFSVTVSIGIACSEEADPDNFDDLMNKADVALYEAKNTGRNRVAVYHNPLKSSAQQNAKNSQRLDIPQRRSTDN
ncbi:MAG: diguanylate cyclase [Coriobacteriales bacterium]|nr:diguanylate cyclase [Coriobacteriales bacterium]